MDAGSAHVQPFSVKLRQMERSSLELRRGGSASAYKDDSNVALASVHSGSVTTPYRLYRQRFAGLTGFVSRF